MVAFPGSSSLIKTGLFASGAVVGALVAYNVRWRYVGDCFFGRTPKNLPITKVEASLQKEKKSNVVIVLLHGMWHDASWYSKLQHLLQHRGYSSYAIDLLPGERFLPGFSQREIVTDLKQTLIIGDGEAVADNKEKVQYILVGHSQGGLVVQSCLKRSPELHDRTKAVVLLGTYPLGLMPPVKALMKQPRNMYNHLGYAWICLTGKLSSLDYLAHIFLLPTTDPSTLPDYTSNLLTAPSDGFITMTHFPQKVGIISEKPTLVLGAKEDIVYPPHLFQNDFSSRFPNATHKTVPRQAHCFMDSVAWDTDMEDMLMNWLDENVR